MDLNTKGRYAVMAMADLAKFGVAQAGLGQAEMISVPLSAIAERQGLSLAYLEQLFAMLRRAGLVESLRGRTGGYRLARDAGEISIAAIMRAVEEPVKMTRCDVGEPGCVGHARCLTHDLWNVLGEQITAFLGAVTLRDVLDGMPHHKSAIRSRNAAQETIHGAAAPIGVAAS